MALKLNLGDLVIHRIIEQETTFLPALDMLPALTPDILAENRQWMRDARALDAEDVLILCFQSYIVKTPHHTILIDSCIGNDKPRPTRPNWNMKTDDTYMRALASTGFLVDDIDFVMCTHLHPDHVGWNTRLEGGRWVPTFPNARYIMRQDEFDRWGKDRGRYRLFAYNEGVFERSVEPVVEAGLADLVSGTHQLTPSLAVEPAPGHTIGHQMLRLTSAGRHALFTGDSFHHPIQLVEPSIPFGDADDL
jgi:glyoxylase-like metal-dependent hydrolase (beta-lactamase superfamily II)